MYKSNKTNSKRKPDKIKNKVSDKRVKVSTSCNSLKDLFNKQQKSSIKVKQGKDYVISLSSDDEDDSLLYKEAGNIYTKLSINHENDKKEMSSNITNNALKKDNNENNFKDEIDNFNDSKSSNADPVFSNASYVSNFKLVILMIIKDPLYENLFDSEDRKIVDDFINKLKSNLILIKVMIVKFLYSTICISFLCIRGALILNINV